MQNRADSGDGSASDQFGAWLVSFLPRTTTELEVWAISAVAVLVAVCGIGSRRLAAQNKKPRAGLDGVADAFGEGLTVAVGGLVEGIGRFLAGQQLWGEALSTATFLRPGVALDRAAAVRELNSAASGPKTARVDAGRLAAWHQWPGAARSAVRLGAVMATLGYFVSPLWSALAAVVSVVLALVAIRCCRRPRTDDAQTYGPGLWAALVQLLRLSAEDQERGEAYWLNLSTDLSGDDSRVLVRLPLQWLGSEKERASLAHAVHTRLPGEWAAAYSQRGRNPYVEFTPKPVPKPRPQLARSVPWQSTGDPFRVFVGQAIEGDRIVDVVVSTETATPHWGVAGDTGSGKSTMLYIPVVHGRQNGWVVDILDNKSNSMIEAEGFSGARIHKTTRACMGAFAEFMTSMIAAEKALGRDGDPQLRALLVPRLLVIDELPTLIRMAYTWWKHGIRQKGAPPFIDWFTIILMMGRSSDHRVVVGGQQFDNVLFGGTIGRKQIGTKFVIGKQDMVSWGVAFGQNAPRFGYDTDVKGRGAYADNKSDPDGGDYTWVREFQAAYITPDVEELLAEAPDAPAWFDAGEMAPWITPGALAQAQEEAAAAAFLPGGKFAPFTRTVVPARRIMGVVGGVPRSGAGTVVLGKCPGTAAGTAEQTAGLAVELAEDAALPATFSLADACKRGILPWRYETARKYLLQRSKRKGIAVPEGITDGRVTYYTEPELTEWLTAWNAVKAEA
ncbi:type IV secretory system conjugative DNA transfer family protein [Streptomyces sp. NPDC056486]|uniref:type IV secretory system conjugative DNA transfer family protein n=1 Tax=Streptomyces sp. NPDC056486 TaxID=3345835 RepID=UPI0036908835